MVYDAADTALYYATNAGLFVVKPTRQEEIKQADGHKILAHKLHLWAGKVYALTTQGNLLLVNDGQATEINQAIGIAPFGIRNMNGFGSRLLFKTDKSMRLINLEDAHPMAALLPISIEPHQINDVLIMDGKILFATNNGIVQGVDLSEVQNVKSATLQVNKLIVNGRQLPLGQMHELEAWQNAVSIQYSVLDFGHTQVPSVFYRVNGREWAKASIDSRTLKFLQLAAGNYTIELKLENAEKPAYKLQFSIKPYIWQRWWF